MTEVLKFDAEKREKAGKGVARSLRREEKLPAVLYGKGLEPIKLALPKKEVTLSYKKGGFMRKLIELNVAGTTYQAVARDVQLHPVTDFIEHLDFLHVAPGSKVHVKVPVRLHNTDRCAGVKRGGILTMITREVELLCSPENIPARIDVDVLTLEIGHSVHINDVELPEGVTPYNKKLNETLVTITGRAKDEGAGEAA
jgi:large subunit ribosomal protein L25